MTIELEQLPTWVCWIAQDKNGAWWGYQVEPLQNYQGWYENEVGQIVDLGEGKPNPNWKDSLKKVR